MGVVYVGAFAIAVVPEGEGEGGEEDGEGARRVLRRRMVGGLPKLGGDSRVVLEGWVATEEETSLEVRHLDLVLRCENE